MSERAFSFEEIDEVSSIQEQLSTAAMDLRYAIRQQVKRTAEFISKRQLVDYDKNRAAIVRQGGDPRLAKEPVPIGMPEVRRRTRHRFRLPLGTEQTAEGRSVSHFAYVYESEPSAKRPLGAHRATIYLAHVKSRPDGEDIQADIFSVNIVGDQISVLEGTEPLAEGELEKPLRLIEAARELYPKNYLR